MISRRPLMLFAFLLLAVAALFACPFFGVLPVSVNSLWDLSSDPLGSKVLWELRLPRILLAFLAGAGLAVSGLVYQAMLQNVLASPYTLGVASGAAFGAALSTRLGVTFSLPGLPSSMLFALIGAALTAVLVMGLSAVGRSFSAVSMLLAGVVISFFFSSLIMLLQYLSDFGQVFAITRWLMGSLDAGGAGFGSAAVLILTGFFIILLLGPQVDLLALGDELAISRGLNARRARLLLFFAVTLIVGAVVSSCGPIGFVGLIIPYVVRALLGHTGHRSLSLASAMLGGSFLVICDTAARSIIAPFEIPVGVVTALLGGPFFLWILIGKRL